HSYKWFTWVSKKKSKYHAELKFKYIDYSDELGNLVIEFIIDKGPEFFTEYKQLEDSLMESKHRIMYSCIEDLIDMAEKVFLPKYLEKYCFATKEKNKAQIEYESAITEFEEVKKILVAVQKNVNRKRQILQEKEILMSKE